MRIPRRVSYNGRSIPVKTRKGEKFRQRWEGEFTGSRIWIAAGLSREDKESTYIHEALHLIAPWLKEKEVRKLEKSLYKFLSKNSLCSH